MDDEPNGHRVRGIIETRPAGVGWRPVVLSDFRVCDPDDNRTMHERTTVYLQALAAAVSGDGDCDRTDRGVQLFHPAD